MICKNPNCDVEFAVVAPNQKFHDPDCCQAYYKWLNREATKHRRASAVLTKKPYNPDYLEFAANDVQRQMYLAYKHENDFAKLGKKLGYSPRRVWQTIYDIQARAIEVLEAQRTQARLMQMKRTNFGTEYVSYRG